MGVREGRYGEESVGVREKGEGRGGRGGCEGKRGGKGRKGGSAGLEDGERD